MLPSSQIIKRTAKNQLKNSWISSMAVSVILMLTVCFQSVFVSFMYSLLASNHKIRIYVGAAVSLFNVVILFALLLPLLQGVLRWFWFQGLEKPLPTGGIFYYFSCGKLFVRSLHFWIALFWKSLVKVALCLLPSAAVRFIPTLIRELSPETESFENLFLGIANGLLMVGLVAALILLMRYFLAPMLLVVDEEAEPTTILRISGELDVSPQNCLTFLASFIGWFFVSALGIPLIYTLPYFFMSYAVFVRFGVTNQRFRMAEWGLPPLI